MWGHLPLGASSANGLDQLPSSWTPALVPSVVPWFSLGCSPPFPSSFLLYSSPYLLTFLVVSVPASLSASVSHWLCICPSFSLCLCFMWPLIVTPSFLFSSSFLAHLSAPLASLSLRPFSFLLSAIPPGLSVPPSYLPSLLPCLPACPRRLPRPASSVSPSPCLSLPLLSGKAAVIYELRTGPAAGAGGPDYSFPEEAACSGMAG